MVVVGGGKERKESPLKLDLDGKQSTATTYVMDQFAINMIII